jgi:phage regulator Rha-like protein
MSDITKTEQLEAIILIIREQRVLLDRDIARVYGVETRDINKAVANNPDKFPTGYLFELTKMEKTELVENFHRFEKLKHATVKPKAFTEKGLYMLATILRSPAATQATLKIIETFAKLRELGKTIRALSDQDKACAAYGIRFRISSFRFQASSLSFPVSDLRHQFSSRFAQPASFYPTS